MSWIRIAADLLRDAMSTSETTVQPHEPPPPPADITGVMGVIARQRAEIDKNFETVVGMVNAQNQQHIRAMTVQRRWNYALTTVVVIVVIWTIVSYWRG